MYYLKKRVPPVVGESDARFVPLRKDQKLCVSNWSWVVLTVAKHASVEKQMMGYASLVVYSIVH